MCVCVCVCVCIHVYIHLCVITYKNNSTSNIDDESVYVLDKFLKTFFSIHLGRVKWNKEHKIAATNKQTNKQTNK